METGIVKFFISEKGYGFITDDKTKKDVFFHVSGLEYEDVRADDKVSFEIGNTKKGDKAISVRFIK